MKPKIIDVWIVFDPKTFNMLPEHRPHNRAFFNQSDAIAYASKISLATATELVVRRFDCEVPESDIEQ